MTDWSYPTYNYPCKDLEAINMSYFGTII